MRFSIYDLSSICIIIVLTLTLTIQDAYDGGNESSKPVSNIIFEGSALLLAEDESTSVINGALVGVLLSQSASPSVVLSALLLND
jgi:hypothetical protein